MLRKTQLPVMSVRGGYRPYKSRDFTRSYCLIHLQAGINHRHIREKSGFLQSPVFTCVSAPVNQLNLSWYNVNIQVSWDITH